MKNKPLRHKEKNTFKFQSFSDRINGIKVDVFHNVKHKYEEESEETTFFFQTVDKWALLNCSESFNVLREEIGYNIRILPQIVVQKDRLVDLLKKHLENKNSYTLQPVLELVSALAKDLRQDFYPYFDSVYELLVPLLSTKSVDQLEWTFQCLAYLFKFLWRYLVNNFNVVFDSLLPLLSSTKPYYVNNFAAQSFAFVARKFKDNEKLLKLILRSLKKCPDSLDGCGRLLFEVVRGVPGQFHSCAENTFKSCFSSLEDDSYPYHPLSQLLFTTVNYCLNNIHAKHISLLWNILKENLKHLYSQWREDKNEKSVKNISLILDMLHEMVSYKNCGHLNDHETLVDLLLDHLTVKNQINENISEKIYSMLSIILLSPVLKLTQEMSSKIVVFTMNYLGENDFMNFVLKIMKHSSFEGLVLPRVVKFCVGKPPMKVLPLLTKLVVAKSLPLKNAEDLLCWTPYTLDFTSLSTSQTFCKTYLDYLSENPLPELLNDLDKTVSILRLLPNLLPIKKTEAISCILIIIQSCCHIDDDPKVFMLLATALETLVLLKPSENLMKICPPEIILDALLPHANQNHPEILRALDFYISMDELNLISLFYDKIKSSLIENLVSPYQKVREYTIHILYEIEKSLETSHEHMVSLLEVCWRAEMIPTTLADYRNKVRELQKLSCTNESVNAGVVKDELDYKVFIKLLIGTLYVNFKLIWDPVSKIIVTYAETLKANQFWSVFGQQVDKIGKLIRENVPEPKIESPFSDDVLSEAYLNLNSHEEKPDHINHRILLWNILSNCIVLCDTKNKDVTNQFLTFMEEEYLKRNSEAAFTWDVCKKDEAAKEETIIEMDEEDLDAEESKNDEIEEKDDPEPDPDRKFKGVTKSLLAQMEVLGKMKTLKQAPRESELSKIYYDFLSHKLPDVQKAALDCIMAYKQKSLTPYRDNLYGIIDDKTFKKELAFFKLDSDSDVIKKEHRADLIPIVLRIMHSKLYQTGTKNVTKHQRKATVIRFLAGCKSEELSTFFKMAFALLQSDVDRNPNMFKMSSEIIKNLNVHKIIPPKRLQSSIYLLNTLLIYCGGLLDQKQLSYLLRILVALMSNVTGVLLQREKVFSGYIKVLRNIRNLCFEGLKKFFSNFENYPWSGEEIDAVFESFIWPYIPSLSSDSLQSPSSLLKLLFIWSKNARFFVLLGKTNSETSPLKSIMDLWSCEKVHGSVSNLIMELVESLLTLQDFERFEKMDGDFVEPININCSAVVDHEAIKMIKISETLNYGSKLLIPFINVILEKLQKKLESKSFVQRDSEVMSRISELVTKSDSSEKLLTLLIPNLIKKSTAEEDVVVPLITTVYNLIKNVENCGKYVLKLAPLFGSVGDVAARKLLFSTVVELSQEKGSESGLDAKLLDDLNAWDRKFVEHPDFTRRLEAFTTIQKMIEEKTVSVNLGVIIMYTCFHFMKTEKDLSMRAHAKNCLEKLCPLLCPLTVENAELKNAIINEAILGQIRKGIADNESDHFREDCISLLGHMARECTEYHIIFKDLSHLTNKVDLEVDFFENIKHLQLHRRVRAMLKFSNLPQTLEEPISTRSITQFVLPIISHYLLTKRYSNKNTIIDSAIAAVGTACKFLPWHQYNTVLASYLKALQNEVDFQKQLVRILVEILNAFHFDLSQADPLIESTGTENADDKELEEERTIQVDKLSRLPKDAANNVVRKINDTILPQLHTILTRKTQSESSHKLSKNDNLDDELILRIPLTVAVVKLLQKLPSKELLDRNLIGVFMKLCTYLKSRVDSVRRVTRETMQTIMVSLGPQYLKTIVREMSGILTRGFHLHVLAYSVHSILVALKPSFKRGDIDKSVSLILQVCKLDLFGGASEEKEVNQIAGKVLEARSTKSFDILNILATYTTDSFLLDLIIPLKEELSRTLSHKMVTKIETCLQNIVLGFTVNEYLEATSLLQLSFGCASESISVLIKGTNERKVDPKKVEYESRRDPDIYLIPSDPKRKKAADIKVCSRTNAHLLVEFGFKLLLFLLKRSKVDTDSHKPHLDPFVDLLFDCIKSQHIKIATLAVKCLTWCLRIELPSIRKNIDKITESLFEILHKYGSAGLSKGDNFDLVMATFKAVAVIVRDVKYHKLNNDHKRALLLYCEQDLDDHDRQATAFSLIHAILSRKIEAPELNEVMKKVSNLSITSNIDSVRQQSLSVMLYYLKEYGLKSENNTLVDYLAFYFSQLSFAFESGRNNALELIKHVINNFPPDFVNEHCGVIFVNVSARLVNDSSPSFREKSGEVIRLLLSKIDNNSKEKLFDITKVWFAHKKIAHKRLAAQLVGLFVQVEKGDFQKRLVEFLPLVSDQFVQGFAENQPAKLIAAEQSDETVDTKEKLKDHFLFQVLSMLVKICNACSKFLKDPTYTNHLETIAEYTSGLLSYPHEWVRKCAVQFLNTIIRTVPAVEIAAIANSPDLEKEGFLLNNTKSKLKSLILDLIAQLVPSENSHEQYLLQCMKLLVYIACVVKDIKNEKDEKGISLNWMVRRIRKSLNYEVVQHPTSTIVRTMVFNWTAAISVKLSKDELLPIASSVLMPLLREMNLDEQSSLKKVAKDAANCVKNKIGPGEYDAIVATLTTQLEVKKAEKKKQRSQLLVTNPEVAAKKKIHKQLKKKVAKKRKMASLKNHTFKKKPRKEASFEDIGATF